MNAKFAMKEAGDKVITASYSTLTGRWYASNGTTNVRCPVTIRNKKQALDWACDHFKVKA